MLAHDELSEPVDLATATVTALLRATLVALQAEVSALTPAHLRWRPAPDAWCINEVIGHLIEAAQRGFAGRMQQLLEQDHPRLEPWDQPAVARARRDGEPNGPALLQTFAQLRTASIHRIERLAPAQGALRAPSGRRGDRHPGPAGRMGLP